MHSNRNLESWQLHIKHLLHKLLTVCDDPSVIYRRKMKDLAEGHWPGFTLGLQANPPTSQVKYAMSFCHKSCSLSSHAHQQLTSDKNQDSGTWHSVRVQRCDFMLAALERQGCQLANDCLGTVALVSLKTKH